MKKIFPFTICIICVLLFSHYAFGQSVTDSTRTFTNPILPSGPDPWAIYHNGYYYYMNTLGDRLAIWKTRDLAYLKSAKKETIWKPPKSGMYSKDIWAPELHFINGKWYIY